MDSSYSEQAQATPVRHVPQDHQQDRHRRLSKWVVFGLVLVGLLLTVAFVSLVLLQLESCCGVSGKAITF